MTNPSRKSIASIHRAESTAFLKDALATCTRDSSDRPIIYTIQRAVSRNGMHRTITPFVIVDNVPVNLAWHYDRCNDRMACSKYCHWANRVQGAGMDMGYHHATCVASAAGFSEPDHAIRHVAF